MQNDYSSGLIGIEALATRLSISLRSVHRILAQGDLPSYRIGRRRLVSHEALNIWLNRQQVTRLR
jgi:excisionase family DNA binding protein